MRKSYLAIATIAAATGWPALALAAEGATVVRDAETGQLRAPTAAEAAALRAAAKPAAGARVAAEPVVQRKLPNGAVMAVVPESLMQFSVVQRNADGSLSRSCIQGADEAAQAAARPQFAKPLSMSTARTARGMAYEVR